MLLSVIGKILPTPEDTLLTPAKAAHRNKP
jgi:hypothetical protein